MERESERAKEQEREQDREQDREQERPHTTVYRLCLHIPNTHSDEWMNDIAIEDCSLLLSVSLYFERNEKCRIAMRHLKRNDKYLPFKNDEEEEEEEQHCIDIEVSRSIVSWWLSLQLILHLRTITQKILESTEKTHTHNFNVFLDFFSIWFCVVYIFQVKLEKKTFIAAS